MISLKIRVVVLPGLANVPGPHQHPSYPHQTLIPHPGRLMLISGTPCSHHALTGPKWRPQTYTLSPPCPTLVSLSTGPRGHACPPRPPTPKRTAHGHILGNKATSQAETRHSQASHHPRCESHSHITLLLILCKLMRDIGLELVVKTTCDFQYDNAMRNTNTFEFE